MKIHLGRIVAGLAVLGLCVLTAGPATAQITTSFEASEGYTGSATGTVLTGQNGWYIPATSSDHSVFTYAGNSLGFPQNPNPAAGDQFIGATAPGDGTFARAQINVAFTADVWTASYDLCAANMGAPAHNNLSSFSLQDSTSARYYIGLNYWHRQMVAGPWNMVYEVFDSTGTGPAIKKPPKQFRQLHTNNWYGQSTTFDLALNQITSVSITDYTTGVTTSYTPTGWYLNGGPGGGTAPLPTGARFFCGGGTGQYTGNIVGWDNLSITPGGGGGAVRGRAVQPVQGQDTSVIKKAINPFRD
jgi:hypothetical protein